jgi:hypothetical protein
MGANTVVNPEYRSLLRCMARNSGKRLFAFEPLWVAAVVLIDLFESDMTKAVKLCDLHGSHGMGIGCLRDIRQIESRKLSF